MYRSGRSGEPFRQPGAIANEIGSAGARLTSRIVAYWAGHVGGSESLVGTLHRVIAPLVRRPIAVAAILAASVVTLAACSSSGESGSAGGKTSAKSSARLTFRPVIELLAPSGSPPTTPRNQESRTGVVVMASRSPSGQIVARYELGPVVLDGTIVKSAKALQNSVTGQWRVDFSMTQSGSVAFDGMAAKEYGQLVAIVLDDDVISAPQINATHFQGSAQVTGTFTERSARQLAQILNTHA